LEEGKHIFGLKGQGFPKYCCRGVAKPFEMLEMANVVAASGRALHGFLLEFKRELVEAMEEKIEALMVNVKIQEADLMA
jgi:hypothetical protein